MKITFHYGDGVINLPADLMAVLPRADLTALRVLLYVANAAGVDVSPQEIAEACACESSQVETALAFWHGAGLLSQQSAAAEAAPTKKAAKASTAVRARGTAKVSGKVQANAREASMPDGDQPDGTPATNVVVKTSATALPAYTTEELAAVLERRRELTALIDECSHVFGKIFNTHEVSQLIGLADYLGLEDDYLLLVLAHCVKIGKKSLRYAVNTAIALYDNGITDAAALQECLKAREEKEAREGKLRSMFGLGSRALTTKEKKMFEAWLSVHHFTTEVIQMAYERTVNATGKPSIPYANSILERWAAAGLNSIEQINEAEAAYEKQGKNGPTAGNSFDTNDFFDAALQRSFGEDYIPGGKGSAQ
jgi:DnaD/phage-associated family protein